MNLRASVKRRTLDALPPAMSAYLRQERPVWAEQFRRTKNSFRTAVNSRSLAKALLSPVEEGTVVWESFAGNGALCNPEALFRALLDHPDHQHLRHTWVLTAPAEDSQFFREFSGHPRVRFVRHRSAAYFATLEASQFLVNNATFPHEYVKRPEQTYLNTWHGTPLKTMGYDMPAGADNARNVLRNFLSADYLLAENPFMSDTMYLKAYRLRNIFRGAIVEEGYPRTDHMFGPTAGDHARDVLRERGIETGGKRVLVYAPTWRGASFYAPSADIAQLRETLEALRASPALDGWVVLLKVHQVVADQVADDPSLADALIPNEVPANQALAIADLLVSDFSSIFVDYLATGRPIAFHIPDIAGYSQQRGLYLTPEELPGPISVTPGELVRTVGEILEKGLTNAYPAEAARYSSLAAAYTAKDDGGSAQRIIDIVFGGREEGYRVRRGFDDGRISLMLYAGGLITNGITSSLLNLLNALDPAVYDVTVLYYRHPNADRKANAAKIPEHVRHVIRDTGLLQYALQGSMRAMTFLPPDAHGESSWAKDAGLWHHEWRRLFGESEFDAVVDFSGYAAYWTRILAHGTGRRTSVWLHNDLATDAERTVGGKKPLLQNLSNVFKLYPAFDALVSVSPDLREINAANLSDFAGPDLFVSARNAIDAERVLRGAGRSSAAGDVPASIDATDLSGAVAALAEAYSVEAVLAEAQRRQALGPQAASARKTFVTVGRLSPEKNHARLLEAFADVARDEPDARLIVIGNGPLRAPLEARAAILGVSDLVTFTGHLSNPYATMAEADCFVMSSDYEGQPIVILEARVLGLPVVTTRFDSAPSAMEGSGGLMVERTPEALAAGMRAFLRGELAAEPFDHEAYNRTIIDEFALVAIPSDAGDGRR